MRNYEVHFLMDLDSVIDYVVDEAKCFISKDTLVAEEIGNGNINYVFKVRDVKTGYSVIVKQADKLLRSSGRPLDLHRNAIEVDVLKIEDELMPGFVPVVYHYSKHMYACTMEDISSYKNLRKELMLQKVFPDFADQITSFIVNTTLPTTDLILSRKKKKERVKFFTNYDCCDISEDLVFTEPYYDYKKRNIITKGNESYVKMNLYEDDLLKSEVGILRNKFMNNSQALIHGDLHSGSIFVDYRGIKVIDPEFAFYGPIGYDIGNVMGNLIIAYCYSLGKGYLKFTDWIISAIKDIWDLSRLKLQEKLSKEVDLPLYNQKFTDLYTQDILGDSLGFAGTEIIRRVVGDSKTDEMYMLSPLENKIQKERILIEIGKWLIINRNHVESGLEVMNECQRIIKAYAVGV